MDEHRQNDQLKTTYSYSVPIRAVALKTCWKQWTIGRGGIPLLVVLHDDDDDDDDYLHIAVEE